MVLLEQNEKDENVTHRPATNRHTTLQANKTVVTVVALLQIEDYIRRNFTIKFEVVLGCRDWARGASKNNSGDQPTCVRTLSVVHLRSYKQNILGDQE